VAGHISGVVRHLIPWDVTHLEFTDDTMILIEPINMGMSNLNLILLRFENMLGHKINFGKSEVIVAGTTTLEKIWMANFL
jgi:hypothetical protein